MDAVLVAGVAVLMVLVGIGNLLLRRLAPRLPPTSQPSSDHTRTVQRDVADVAEWVRDQRSPDVDLTALVRELDDSIKPLAQSDALVQFIGGHQAIVFGPESRAQELGTVVGRAAQPLASATRYATSAVSASIEGAKSTGYLVQLSNPVRPGATLTKFRPLAATY